jgi:RNA polymerase sigma-70 factor, ECF subfamily
MLAGDVRLVQSAHPPRAGAADVGMFFDIYAQSARRGSPPPGSRAAR